MGLDKEIDKMYRSTPPDIDIDEELEDKLNKLDGDLPERMRKELGDLPEIKEEE